MTFEKVEKLQLSGRKGMPARVALICSGRSGGRPACRIALSAEFCAKAGIKAGDRFDLLLGTGGDRALLRLQRNSNDGIATAVSIPRGGVLFRLGHLARFGTEAREGEYCDAILADADTIDVVLPAWADEE